MPIDIKSGFSIAPAFSLHNNFNIASVESLGLIYNQFGIIQVLQRFPILPTSNWSGTFFLLFFTANRLSDLTVLINILCKQVSTCVLIVAQSSHTHKQISSQQSNMTAFNSETLTRGQSKQMTISNSTQLIKRFLKSCQKSLYRHFSEQFQNKKLFFKLF